MASRSAPEHPEDKWACGIACFECDHAERNWYGTGRIYTITYRRRERQHRNEVGDSHCAVEPYDETSRAS